MRRVLAIGGLSGVLALTVACGKLTDEARWWDQLQADSPCYRVDLLDGLDESSTSEVDDLFACINHHGHIEPLMPVVGDGLHWDARNGDPAAIELARAVNLMVEVDVDPFVIAGLLSDAIAAEDRPIDEMIDLYLELAYGSRANRVRSGSIELTSQEDLESGVLVPLAPVFPVVATTLLDDPTDTAGWVGSWLAAPETKRWIRTVEGWIDSEHPVVQQPVDELIVHLGELLVATRSPDNDEWADASGDSLRDLLDVYWFRDEAPILEVVSDEATILLTDPGLRAALEPTLVDLHAAGNLQGVPSDLVWMTEVDRLGNPRTPDEVSALEGFARLLARSNGPVDCLSVYTNDNLSVEVLGLLAELDPDTVLLGLEVVAWITGNSVTDWALEGAVDLGICDGIDQQTLDDLDSVATITQPEAYDLLVAFIRLLDVLEHDAQQDRLPVFADLIEDLYDSGGYAPLEEVVRDVGEEPLLVDLVDLVPVLAEPGAYGITAGDEAATDLTDAIDLVEWVFVVDEQLDMAGWERMRPLVRPVLTHESTWVAVDHATALMIDDRTQTSQLLDLLSPLLDLDPELALLDQIAPLLGDPELQGPVLRIVETPQVTGSLLASAPAEGQEEVPLAFLSRLMIGGTFDDLLALVDMLFGTGQQ